MPSALCASRTAKVIVFQSRRDFSGRRSRIRAARKEHQYLWAHAACGRKARPDQAASASTSIGSCSQPLWKRGARWDEEQPEDRRNRQVYPDRHVDTCAGTLQKAAALDHRLGPSIHFSSMLRPAFVSARSFAACDRHQRRCSRQARTTSTVLQEPSQNSE
jgi:hypothetical protein